MQRHLSYYFFSLTTDIYRESQNPLVPAAKQGMGNEPGVRVHYFCFWLSINSLSSQLMATLKKGDQWQMWEFIRI